MRSLNVGELVHRVLIQQRNTDAIDASGAPDETTGWTTLAYAMMSRTDRRAERGGETFRADQVSALMTTRWRMRYTPTMDPDLVDVQKARRIVVGEARVHDIVDAEVLDRKVGIELRTVASSKVAA